MWGAVRRYSETVSLLVSPRLVCLVPASGAAVAQVTTTDQATGAVGQEPLKTLKSFRTGKLLDWVPEPSWRHEVYFGWHMVRGPAGRRRRSLSK
jgi:hypothetical protein